MQFIANCAERIIQAKIEEVQAFINLRSLEFKSDDSSNDEPN